MFTTSFFSQLLERTTLLLSHRIEQVIMRIRSRSVHWTL